MIAQHLHHELDRHGGRLAVVQGDRQESFLTLARLSDTLADRWAPLAGKRVGLCIVDPFSFVAAAAALDQLDAHVFLAGGRGEEEVNRLSSDFRWSARLGDGDVGVFGISTREPALTRPGGRGLVTILTSGTSGTPKAANHTWATLAAPVRRDEMYTGTRWLCAYPLNLYAGLQVLLQALVNHATLVIPASLNAKSIGRALVEGGVQYASGTPTFWRGLLAFASREGLLASPLRQITMGGEIATQDVLDGLRSVFPAARVVHIYASTEMGRLFSVSDGKEGFPTRFLAKSPEPGIELRIFEGKLMARSRNAMIAYDGQAALREQSDGWFSTGDLVEVRGDRVLFRGRSTDVINVGGRKVMPSDVEAVLRLIPGVAEVRVYARRSSLAGQLVAADLVLASGADAELTRRQAQRITREKLEPYQVPRWLNVVAEIPKGESFKILRRETRT